MRVGAGERDHPSLRPLLSALITQLIMMRMAMLKMLAVNISIRRDSKFQLTGLVFLGVTVTLKALGGNIRLKRDLKVINYTW